MSTSTPTPGTGEGSRLSSVNLETEWFAFKKSILAKDNPTQNQKFPTPFRTSKDQIVDNMDVDTNPRIVWNFQNSDDSELMKFLFQSFRRLSFSRISSLSANCFVRNSVYYYYYHY